MGNALTNSNFSIEGNDHLQDEQQHQHEALNSSFSSSSSSSSSSLSSSHTYLHIPNFKLGLFNGSTADSSGDHRNTATSSSKKPPKKSLGRQKENLTAAAATAAAATATNELAVSLTTYSDTPFHVWIDSEDEKILIAKQRRTIFTEQNRVVDTGIQSVDTLTSRVSGSSIIIDQQSTMEAALLPAVSKATTTAMSTTTTVTTTATTATMASSSESIHVTTATTITATAAAAGTASKLATLVGVDSSYLNAGSSKWEKQRKEWLSKPVEMDAIKQAQLGPSECDDIYDALANMGEKGKLPRPVLLQDLVMIINEVWEDKGVT